MGGGDYFSAVSSSSSSSLLPVICSSACFSFSSAAGFWFSLSAASPMPSKRNSISGSTAAEVPGSLIRGVCLAWPTDAVHTHLFDAFRSSHELVNGELVGAAFHRPILLQNNGLIGGQHCTVGNVEDMAPRSEAKETVVGEFMDGVECDEFGTLKSGIRMICSCPNFPLSLFGPHPPPTFMRLE